MRRLAERGVAHEAIARLVCPVGIAGIRGRAPEVIAAAVVAQLLARAGRSEAAEAAVDEQVDAGHERRLV